MPGTRFCTASVSALLGLFLLPTSLQAQNEVARGSVKGNLPVVDKPVDKPSDFDHRVEALEERLREQSEKLDMLMVLVAEQQRVIAKLTSNDRVAGSPTRRTEVVSATADSAPTSRGSKLPVEVQNQ